MGSDSEVLEQWTGWKRELKELLAQIRRGKSTNVSAGSLRQMTSDFVRYYFRFVRPELIRVATSEDIEKLDKFCQDLNLLSAGRNRRTSYLSRLKSLSKLVISLDTPLEIRASSGSNNPVILTTVTEGAILNTLDKILPTSALSYNQVLKDLTDISRTSYRGTAAELREVVRELLDHLAPDEEVLKTVTLAKDQKRPSMKQKTIFILKNRGMGETQRKPAEDAVSALEENVGSLARSVYDRGSLATHVVSTRSGVLTFKGYADAVLADLLEVHSA